MNGPGDIPLTQGVTPDRPCGLISIIPDLGMSSCRGRAEAFARRLQSKLRTLGSQNEDNTQEEEPIINGGATNTWITSQEAGQPVTDLQPLRHESDSFFDFDCELESPGSPVDECEYLRLIESASNTPHNSATESGYACTSMTSSHSSSSDGPYYDPETIENGEATQIHMQQPRITGIAEYVKTLKIDDISESPEISLTNGHGSHSEHEEEQQQTFPTDISECESLPPSQDSSETTETVTEIENSIAAQNLVLDQLSKESLLVTSNHNGHSSINSTEDTELRLQIPKESEVAVQQPDPECIKKEESPLSDTEEPQKEIHIDTTNTEVTKNRGKITSVLDTDDEDDCRPQRVRRCSSLKTGKTPPGTPGRKKIVRFADVLGLDLADVKTFLDEIPTIPKSAFEDLEIMESEPPVQLGPKSDKLLMPLFQQPGGLPTFLDLVRDKQVSLENAAVSDNLNQTISGSVRVRNLDFHKSVHIRYTIDNWRTYADLQGTYVENSCDGFSDKFTFILFGNSMHVGQRLEFAVRFQCKGQQFWDNNFGANYCFQCLPATTQGNLAPLPQVIPSHHNSNECSLMSPAAGETWCGFY